MFCTLEYKLYFTGPKGGGVRLRGRDTSSVLFSHYCTHCTPVSGAILQEKALRSVLYGPRRDTNDAPGEFPLQVCPRWVSCGGGTGCGGAPRVLASPPSNLAFLARGRGLGPGVCAPQRCNPRVYTFLACLLVVSHFWDAPVHPRVVFVRWCLAQRVSEVIAARRMRFWRVQLRAAGAAYPRPPTRPGLTLRPNSGSFTTSPSTCPRTSPTFKETLSAARRDWPRAAAARVAFQSGTVPASQAKESNSKVYCSSTRLWYYISDVPALKKTLLERRARPS